MAKAGSQEPGEDTVQDGEVHKDDAELTGADAGEEKAADRRLSDTGGEGEGEELGEQPGETEEEAEARRAANRAKRLRKKDRQRRAQAEKDSELAASRAEIGELRQRLANLENRSHQVDAGRVDEAISQAQAKLNDARALRKKLLASDDPEERAKIDEVDEWMYKARRTIENLQYQKQAIEKSPPAGAATGDDRVLRMAKNWQSKNSWFDPDGGDEDSAIAVAIDRQVANEFDPGTAAYWNELDRRLKRRLSHLFENAGRRREEAEDDDGGESERGTRRRQAPPMAGGGGGNGGTSRPGEFVLSRERREALEEAGYTPGTDPWKRMVKRYQQQDEQRRRAS